MIRCFFILCLCAACALQWSCKKPIPPHKPSAQAQKLAAEIGKPELIPLIEAMEAVRPLNKPMGTPQLFDWLSEHEEKGQTFAEYLNSRPTLPDANRKIIYVQPLGNFTEGQRKIVALTADYLARFFNLPVKLNEPLPLSLVPKSARRASPFEKGQEQILTGFVLKDLLLPRLPADAAAMIALTAQDLWPGKGWNYLFGQALLHEHVGVWSMHMFGNPDTEYGDFELCLSRTLKIASHETGHMFSMAHCTKYECNLSGTNHIGETDSRQLDVCPECMAKICWGMKYDPLQRYEKLLAFCRAQKLTNEIKYFQSAYDAVLQTRK